jgi:hypothetical protein
VASLARALEIEERLGLEPPDLAQPRLALARDETGEDGERRDGPLHVWFPCWR